MNHSNLCKPLRIFFNSAPAIAFFRAELLTRTDIPERLRIQKTVFVKAPRAIPYGEVMKIIDAIKGAGAEPIGLQLDGLK